jgi:hypothetical protein
MATAQALARERSAVARWQWIIGAEEDLVWFIGSVAASYALLGLIRFDVSPLLIFLVWAFVFDGPHVFGTFSRTYLDAEEWRTRARLLWASLAFFALGPALHLAGFGIEFFFFASLWAYYHLVKQHYGFMVLYKKKNHDLARADNRIDRIFLLFAFWYPFVRFILVNQEAHKRVPFSVENQGAGAFERLIWWGFVASAIIFAARQAQKLSRRERLNAPKQLLLASAIPMHWVVFAALATDARGPVLAVPLLTIFHNIQYHRLIWFHNRNKYRQDEASRRRHGLAVRISRYFIIYAAAGLIFNLIYHFPRYLMAAPYGLAASFFWGYAFIHYYLDSRIWRVRRDRHLSESLRMAES